MRPLARVVWSRARPRTGFRFGVTPWPAGAAGAPAPARARLLVAHEHGVRGLDLPAVRLVVVSPPPGAVVRGRVLGWLPASESDYVDARGLPAARWHVAYHHGELDGEEEVSARFVRARAAGPSRSRPPRSPARRPGKKKLISKEGGGGNDRNAQYISLYFSGTIQVSEN
mgnify:CR=1 FL=1